MPGDHGYDNEEKERKQRIKKMKAKTSKMRLTVANKKLAKKDIRNPNRDLSDPNWKSNEEHNMEYLKKRDKDKRPSYSDGMGNFGDQSLQH